MDGQKQVRQMSASHRGPTRAEDARRGAGPPNALLGRKVLRREIPE
jgi:hypothetical protein